MEKKERNMRKQQDDYKDEYIRRKEGKKASK